MLELNSDFIFFENRQEFDTFMRTAIYESSYNKGIEISRYEGTPSFPAVVRIDERMVYDALNDEEQLVVEVVSLSLPELMKAVEEAKRLTPQRA